MTRYFDFDDGAHGLSVVVAKQPLLPGCMSPAEVQYQIEAMKADLDRLREAMLKALPKAGLRAGKIFDA